MADSNLSDYKKVIAKIANTIDPSEWERADWSEAVALIDQSVLDDAYLKSLKMHSPYQHIVCIGPVKNIHRVQEKKNIEGYTSFKIVCDLMRSRCITHVCNFQFIIERLRKDAALFHLRGGGTHGSYATYEEEKGLVYKDIAQFLYAFMPTSGHILEIQFLEPLAAHTFHTDSVLRSLEKDDPIRPVDVWTNGFYEKLRECILAMANGDDLSLFSLKEMEELRDFVYGKNEVPHEVSMVLKELKYSLRGR